MLMLFLLRMLFMAAACFAAETDNFTNREAAVRDALVPLNHKTQTLLDRALLNANRLIAGVNFVFPNLLSIYPFNGGCNRQTLFHELQKQVGATPVGQIEAWARFSPRIERIQQPLLRGIYFGIPLDRYPGMVTGIDPTIRLNGRIIGADKLGHFMAEGYGYYQRAVAPGGSLDAAIQWGISTENTYFGLQVSGVKSFADLSANLSGFHFWASILDGPNPYYGCLHGEFVKLRPFDWAEYVTDAWDEGINCSQFSEWVEPVVQRNFRRLNTSCPVQGSEDRCSTLANSAYAQWNVSPICQQHAHSNQTFQK